MLTTRVTLRLAYLMAFLNAATASASAETTPPQGAPFCENKDDLQEYMTAMIKNDPDWVKTLKGCAVLKGGVKIGVIEEYPSDSDFGHVEKVRVFGNGGSAVGYIIRMTIGQK